MLPPPQFETNSVPVPRFDPPAIVAKADPSPRAGYPLRGNPWWVFTTHNGVRTRHYPDVAHLMQGEHAGHFPERWLKSLTRDELLALHSDDHDGTVQWGFVPKR